MILIYLKKLDVHTALKMRYEELIKYQPITLNIIKDIIKNRYTNFCYFLTKEKYKWLKTVSDIKIETDKQFDSEYKILKSIQNFSNITWSNYIEICDIRRECKLNESHYDSLFKTMRFEPKDIEDVLKYLYKDKLLTIIWLKYHDLPFDYIKKNLKNLPIRNLLIRQQIPYKFLIDNIEIFKPEIDIVIQYQDYSFEEMRNICDMFDKWMVLILRRFETYSQNIVADPELSKRLFKLIIGKYINC